MKMKSLLAGLLLAGSAAAADYPWIAIGTFTCQPAGCFQYSLVSPRGYGSVQLSAQMLCANGVECRGAVSGYTAGCRSARSLEATVGFQSDSTYLEYDVERGGYRLVYAQTMRVTAEMYTAGLFFGGWYLSYRTYQYADCFTGSTKTYAPLGGSGTC